MLLLNFIDGSSGAEEKVTKLQEALKEVQNTHIKEVDEMNAQLDRQRERTEELTEAVRSFKHHWTVGRFCFLPVDINARSLAS